MKKHWMYRFLDEAAFPAMVLALALSQRAAGVNSKPVSLPEKQAPARYSG